MLSFANDLQELIKNFFSHLLMSQIPNTNSCQTNGARTHHCVQVDVNVIWKKVDIFWVKFVDLEGENKKASKNNYVGDVSCKIWQRMLFTALTLSQHISFIFILIVFDSQFNCKVNYQANWFNYSLNFWMQIKLWRLWKNKILEDLL